MGISANRPFILLGHVNAFGNNRLSFASILQTISLGCRINKSSCHPTSSATTLLSEQTVACHRRRNCFLHQFLTSKAAEIIDALWEGYSLDKQGMSGQDVRILLHYIMDNNCFANNSDFHHKSQRLAMRISCSPLLSGFYFAFF